MSDFKASLIPKRVILNIYLWVALASALVAVLARGVYTYDGMHTKRSVAEVFGHKYTDIRELI
jgi:alanine dehydrogenase